MKLKRTLSIALGIPALMVAFGEPNEPTDFWTIAMQIIAFGVLVAILAVNSALGKGVEYEN